MHTTVPHFSHVQWKLNSVVLQTSHITNTPSTALFHAICWVVQPPISSLASFSVWTIEQNLSAIWTNRKRDVFSSSSWIDFSGCGSQRLKSSSDASLKCTTNTFNKRKLKTKKAEFKKKEEKNWHKRIQESGNSQLARLCGHESTKIVKPTFWSLVFALLAYWEGVPAITALGQTRRDTPAGSILFGQNGRDDD